METINIHTWKSTAGDAGTKTQNNTILGEITLSEGKIPRRISDIALKSDVRRPRRMFEYLDTLKRFRGQCIM